MATHSSRRFIPVMTSSGLTSSAVALQWIPVVVVGGETVEVLVPQRPTVRIPRETIRECAAGWRAELAAKGLVRS